jgi:hypothetical protein
VASQQTCPEWKVIAPTSLHQIAAADLPHEPADFRRACKAHPFDAAAGRQRSTGSAARAWHDVDNASGHPCFTGKLGHVDRGERCVFGRLHNDGVACGKRRRSAPAEQEQREVPGKDKAAGAPRATDRPGLVARDGQGAPPLHMACHVGEVAERADQVAHIAGSMRQQLAAVERLKLGEHMLVFLKDVGKAMQVHAAIVGGHRSPAAGAEGVVGGGDGRLNVVCSQGMHLGEHLTGSGVAGGDRFTARAGDILAPHHARERSAAEKRLNFRKERNSGGSSGHGHTLSCEDVNRDHSPKRLG